jgi:catechol 2,3-dioxygenase-like lactoylglutathione lyase family enzyme
MYDEIENLRIENLLEAALYVDDLDRAEAFFRDTLGLELLGKEAGRHAFFRAGQCVLLLFNPETTRKEGFFPVHGTEGAGHVAFAISADSWDPWHARFEERGVAIEKEITWPRGGRSLYFRDPSGNLIELVTPGCWGLPSGW